MSFQPVMVLLFMAIMEIDKYKINTGPQQNEDFRAICTDNLRG